MSPADIVRLNEKRVDAQDSQEKIPPTLGTARPNA